MTRPTPCAQPTPQSGTRTRHASCTRPTRASPSPATCSLLFTYFRHGGLTLAPALAPTLALTHAKVARAALERSVQMASGGVRGGAAVDTSERHGARPTLALAPGPGPGPDLGPDLGLCLALAFALGLGPILALTLSLSLAHTSAARGGGAERASGACKRSAQAARATGMVSSGGTASGASESCGAPSPTSALDHPPLHLPPLGPHPQSPPRSSSSLWSPPTNLAHP